MITLFASRRRTVPSVETRPLILTDNGTSSWRVALARWVHVAVSCREQTQPNIPTVLVDPLLQPGHHLGQQLVQDRRIECILIEGVHASGGQVALVIG